LKKNIFVLTTGLSGSSVLTGLIKQAGFWCGEKTEFKDNGTGKYETYENSQFVALNNRLVELSGKIFDSKSWYNDSLRGEFTDLLTKVDLTDFKQFVLDCESNQMWVLKDPKLWMTIGFWLELFKEQELNVVLLTRNINQLWLSQTNKRIIYGYQYLKKSEEVSQMELIQFLKIKNIDCLVLEYDSLIDDSEHNLKKLNQFLNSQLTLSDFNSIYTEKKKSLIPFLLEVKAILIYIKNYTLRIR